MRSASSIACLGILFIVTSCRETPVPEEQAAAPVFFDLSQLVRDDIRQLKAAGCGLVKTSVIDGETTEQPEADVDFEKELQPLIDADINKPAWKDLFRADTAELGSIRTVTYRSHSDKTNIRSMQVEFSGPRVLHVGIRKSIRSFAFGYDAQIDYFPGKGYRIHSTQKAFLIPNFDLKVQADFTCK